MKDKNIELYFVNKKENEELFSYVDFLYRKFSSDCVDFPGRDDTLDGRVIIRRNGVFPEAPLRYMLSSERKYFPTHISCSEKNDYSKIEKILNEENFENFELTNNIWDRIFNNKEIVQVSED